MGLPRHCLWDHGSLSADWMSGCHSEERREKKGIKFGDLENL